MTPSSWLAKARQQRDALRCLLDRYHPESRRERPDMPITAPAAQAACDSICTEIRAARKGPPGPRFDAALEAGDVGTICDLLNEAWFGVPESTSCWGITGFSQAVDLLEDPPEWDGPEDET